MSGFQLIEQLDHCSPLSWKYRIFLFEVSFVESTFYFPVAVSKQVEGSFAVWNACNYRAPHRGIGIQSSTTVSLHGWYWPTSISGYRSNYLNAIPRSHKKLTMVSLLISIAIIFDVSFWIALAYVKLDWKSLLKVRFAESKGFAVLKPSHSAQRAIMSDFKKLISHFSFLS